MRSKTGVNKVAVSCAVVLSCCRLSRASDTKPYDGKSADADARMRLAHQVACQSTTCQTGACPTDNPVTGFFGNGNYSWSSQVAWGNVYSIDDFPGSTLQERVDKAAAAAATCSPSTPTVVYLPPASYSSTTDIIIPSNTVLRGSAPTTAAAKVGKEPGPLAPASLITFPQLSLSMVGCTANATVVCSNVGVVHLDLDGAGVRIYAGNGSTFAIVHGNRIRNVNYRYPGGPGSTWRFAWPYRFSTSVSVSQSPNLLVGNNLLGKATLALNTTVNFTANGHNKPFSGTVPFPVDNRYGISVGQPSGTATVNASVDGNYVYQNGRVGIQWNSQPASSAQGVGTRIVNNHVEVAANTTCWSVTGGAVAGGSDTNENRGYEQTGPGGSYAAGNSGHIHRQTAGWGPYDTVDGEGVLQQPQDGMDANGNVWLDNDLSGGTSGYMAYYNLANITNNVVQGNSVNLDQSIGVLDCTKCSVAGNVCTGNSQPCKGM